MRPSQLHVATASGTRTRYCAGSYSPVEVVRVADPAVFLTSLLRNYGLAISGHEGENAKIGPCPGHGGSLHVRRDTLLWYCFACHVGGDRLDLVQWLAFRTKERGTRNSREAVRLAAELAGITSGNHADAAPLSGRPVLPRPRPEFDRWCWTARLSSWSRSTTRRSLELIATGLALPPDSTSLTSLRAFSVVAPPRPDADGAPVLAVPMFDADGHLCGVRFRERSGRKWSAVGSHNGYYVTVDLRRADLLACVNSAAPVIVCEGLTDAIAALTLGITPLVIGLPCARHVRGLEHLVPADREIIVIGDSDGPGADSVLKVCDTLGHDRCRVAIPTDAKDLRELVVRHGRVAARAWIESSAMLGTRAAAATGAPESGLGRSR